MCTARLQSLLDKSWGQRHRQHLLRDWRKEFISIHGIGDGFTERLYASAAASIVYFNFAGVTELSSFRFGDFLNAPEKKDADYREIPQAGAALLANPNYELTPAIGA